MFCLLPIKQLFIAHFQKNTPLRLVLALVIAFMMLADLLALASPQTLPAKYKNSQSIIFEAIRRVEVLSSRILLISKLRPFFSRKTTLYNKRQEFQQWESYFPSFLFAKVSTFLVRIVRVIPGLFYLALEAEMVFPTFPVKTWRIFVLFRSKVQKIRRTVLQQTHITENMKI